MVLRLCGLALRLGFCLCLGLASDLGLALTLALALVLALALGFLVGFCEVVVEDERVGALDAGFEPDDFVGLVVEFVVDFDFEEVEVEVDGELVVVGLVVGAGVVPVAVVGVVVVGVVLLVVVVGGQDVDTVVTATWHPDVELYAAAAETIIVTTEATAAAAADSFACLSTVGVHLR